jgi:ribosomal protein L40E
MVSNEEIKKMLKERRSGKTEPKKEAPTPVPPKSTAPVESQTCESCGAQNPKDAKFCIKCGKTVKAEIETEEKKKVETVPEHLPRSGMDGVDYKTCPNCSHQNQPQAKFCVVCGHKLEETTVEGEPMGVSRLDRVQDTSPPEEEETTVDQKAEETPAVAELVDEELVQEETEKRSLLSRRVPEEEAPSEDVPLETITDETPEITPDAGEETPTKESVSEAASEELNVTETAPLEVPIPEAASEEEELSEELSDETSTDDELPQVKTFKLGQESLKTGKTKNTEADLETEEVVSEGDTEEVSPATSDPMEKIKKAKELLDIGAITEEEFEEIKKKYLAKI